MNANIYPNAIASYWLRLSALISLLTFPLVGFGQAPESPTDFVVTPVGTTFELTWVDNATNEDQYTLIKEWTDVFENRVEIALPANIEAYSDAEVVPNILYRYTIYAVNESGFSGDEVSATGIIVVDIPAPANVTAAAGPYMSILITFTDNSDLELYYEIQHSSDPNEADFYAKETVGGGELNSTITHYISDPPFNLVSVPAPNEVFYFANTTVYIKIRAVLSANGIVYYGPFSPLVSAVTNPVPPTPTEFSAAVEAPNIHLTWQDNSLYEANFLLAKFQGEYSPNTGTLIRLPANTTEYIDTNVEPNVTYNYRIRALDLIEATAWPPEFLGELLLEESRVAETSAMWFLLPEPPTDVSATALSPTDILVDFSDTGNLEHWYEVLVTTTPDESSAIGTFEGDIPIEINNLEPGTTYYFRVRGVTEINGGVFYGAYSDVVSATTLSALPDVPVAMPATNVNGNSFSANWQSAEGADYYELDVYNLKDLVYLKGYESKVVNATSAIVTGARGVNRYVYVVRAVNEAGESANSDSIYVTKGKPQQPANARVSGALSDDEANDSNALTIQFFPNPVTNHFQVIVNARETRTVLLEIINLQGAAVLCKEVSSNTPVEVDASTYSSGVYLIRAVHNKCQDVMKMIKR